MPWKSLTLVRNMFMKHKDKRIYGLSQCVFCSAGEQVQPGMGEVNKMTRMIHIVDADATHPTAAVELSQYLLDPVLTDLMAALERALQLQSEGNMFDLTVIMIAMSSKCQYKASALKGILFYDSF